MVLGFSEMLDDDRPDHTIWMDDDKLTEHFEELKAKRAEQRGGKNPDDDWSGWEKGPDVETNQLAEQLLNG